MNKYTSISLKGYVLEVDLEYPKELRELHNDYPLVPDNLDIKREMLSEYQLRIVYLDNISIGNIKKILPNTFYKENYMLHYENLKLCLRLGLKQTKPYIEFKTQKRIRAEKHGDKDTKVLCKLIDNAYTEK